MKFNLTPSPFRLILRYMFTRQNLSFPSFDSSFVFFLFRKSPGFDDYSETEKLKDTPVNFSRIRCPLCDWQPHASSRWCCSGFGSHFGCGTEWNTFDTRGRCPGCGYQWKWTDCLRCYRSSPHEAWYEDETE